eukprot:TRINITY_DN95676_c0_g1_i1.p1 TRINITY_DN95676_c0_g1~~TRINITY_DN95676_c0_g1_i1.p1  ORF type:complete len:386 (-),score=73.52 TRINITY_DN95676_c0_g1_i1:70-1170(-)
MASMSTGRSLVKLTDRAILRVAGENSGRFLQGLCTQDIIRTQQEGIAATPAAFLSPKGKVLVDALVVPRGSNEFLLDVHRDVSKSLVRMLIRHRLREPLTIEDISEGHQAVAALPLLAAEASAAAKGSDSIAQSGSSSHATLPTSFFADPRFSGLGHRAILENADALSVLGEGSAEHSAELSDYHLWRVCCAVPEGPADLPVDELLPLHANLDLLNFVSFSKGCYVGQELTTRTKHRGAVRRRYFSVVASESSDDVEGGQFAASLQNTEATDPLPPKLLRSNVVLRPEESADAEVMATKPGSADSKKVGVLHSTAANLGLCMLRCEGTFNNAENFSEAPLEAGTRLTTQKGLQLFLRAPPYAFASE